MVEQAPSALPTRLRDGASAINPHDQVLQDPAAAVAMGRHGLEAIHPVGVRRSLRSN